MKEVYFQRCRHAEGWVPIIVPSLSTEGVSYRVDVSPWAYEESICSCPSYHFRSSCKHQAKAAAQVCYWNGLQDQEQTPEQKREKICPRCGRPTKWEIEIVDDE